MFQNSCDKETGLSHFHKIAVTVMKASYEKLELKLYIIVTLSAFVNGNFRGLLLKVVLENLRNNKKPIMKALFLFA